MPKYTFTFSIQKTDGTEIYKYVVPHIQAKNKQYAIRIAQTQLEKEHSEFNMYQILSIEEEE